MILTHWGRVTHICVGKLIVIGSDKSLSPVWRQAIIWTNAGILLIGPLGANFSDIFNQNSKIFIQENALENGVSEMASILSQPQCVEVINFPCFLKKLFVMNATFLFILYIVQFVILPVTYDKWFITISSITQSFTHFQKRIFSVYVSKETVLPFIFL